MSLWTNNIFGGISITKDIFFYSNIYINQQLLPNYITGLISSTNTGITYNNLNGQITLNSTFITALLSGSSGIVYNSTTGNISLDISYIYLNFKGNNVINFNSGNGNIGLNFDNTSLYQNNNTQLAVSQSWIRSQFSTTLPLHFDHTTGISDLLFDDTALGTWLNQYTTGVENILLNSLTGFGEFRSLYVDNGTGKLATDLSFLNLFPVSQALEIVDIPNTKMNFLRLHTDSTSTGGTIEQVVVASGNVSLRMKSQGLNKIPFYDAFTAITNANFTYSPTLNQLTAGQVILTESITLSGNSAVYKDYVDQLYSIKPNFGLTKTLTGTGNNNSYQFAVSVDNTTIAINSTTGKLYSTLFPVSGSVVKIDPSNLIDLNISTSQGLSNSSGNLAIKVDNSTIIFNTNPSYSGSLSSTLAVKNGSSILLSTGNQLSLNIGYPLVEKSGVLGLQYDINFFKLQDNGSGIVNQLTSAMMAGSHMQITNTGYVNCLLNFTNGLIADSSNNVSMNVNTNAFALGSGILKTAFTGTGIVIDNDLGHFTVPNYTAGNAITISNSQISASYTGGSGINISGNNISTNLSGAGGISVSGNIISLDTTKTSNQGAPANNGTPSNPLQELGNALSAIGGGLIGAVTGSVAGSASAGTTLAEAGITSTTISTLTSSVGLATTLGSGGLALGLAGVGLGLAGVIMSSGASKNFGTTKVSTSGVIFSQINNTNPSTSLFNCVSTGTGTVVIQGGLGVDIAHIGRLFVDSTDTSALTVSGGISASNNNFQVLTNGQINLGNIVLQSNSYITLPTTGQPGIGTASTLFLGYCVGNGYYFSNANSGDIAIRNSVGNNILFGLGGGGGGYQMKMSSSQFVIWTQTFFGANVSSSNTATGTITVLGGIGISGSIYGGNIYQNNNQVLSVAGTNTSISNGTVSVISNPIFSGITTITNTTNSTNTATGALIVNGGLGISGKIYASNIYQNNNQVVSIAGTNTSISNGTVSIIPNPIFSGITTISNSTISTNTATGALIVNGGLGISGNIYSGNIYQNNSKVVSVAGTNTSISNGTISVIPNPTFSGITTIINTTISTNTANGALIVNGGLGISGNIYSGDHYGNNIYSNGVQIPYIAGNNISISGNTISSNATVVGNSNFTGITYFTNTTNSTSPTNGAITIQGGVGISQNLSVGNSIAVNLSGSSGSAFLTLLQPSLASGANSSILIGTAIGNGTCGYMNFTNNSSPTSTNAINLGIFGATNNLTLASNGYTGVFGNYAPTSPIHIAGTIRSDFSNITFPTTTTNLANQYGLSIIGGATGALNNSILLWNNNGGTLGAGSAIDFSNYGNSPSGRISGFDDNGGSTVFTFSNFQHSGAQSLVERFRIDGFGLTTISGNLSVVGTNSAESRYNCNNGNVYSTGWVWGQQLNDVNFSLSKKYGTTETKVFSCDYINANITFSTSVRCAGDLIAKTLYLSATGITPTNYPLHVLGSGYNVQATGTYYIQGNSNGIGSANNYTGTFCAKFDDRIIASEVWTPSDIRLKENISYLDLDNCYKFLTNIKPKSFTWKGQVNPRTNFGYIAQDALKEGFKNLTSAIPSEELLEYKDDEITCRAGIKFIFNYQDVIPILHKVILDLKEKIDTLESRLGDLGRK